jgi:hypothetical protein
MDNKPNVFPTPEQMQMANETGDMIAKQVESENNVQPTQYNSTAEQAAALEMKKRTEEQLKARDEQLRKNEEIAKETEQKRNEQMNEKHPYENGNQQPPVPPTPPINNNNGGYMDSPSNRPSNDAYIEVLSQPQMNQPYDIIPLPSEGKLYPSKKKSVKVAFLTTADENILTSPNLLESGKFLEILINRKLLEPDLRYNDLLPGDRNAIMLWLRATGYGEMYEIIAYDENNEPFDTEVNLSQLKTINLNVEPDADGLFTYTLPLSKAVIRFKMLTVGELDRLEELLEQNKDNPVNEETTMVLESQIVEINGNKDRTFIKDFINNMRLLDSKSLREHFNSIECGIDMTLNLQTPGGGSITTFLPLTPKFFWPDFRL